MNLAGICKCLDDRSVVKGIKGFGNNAIVQIYPFRGTSLNIEDREVEDALFMAGNRYLESINLPLQEKRHIENGSLSELNEWIRQGNSFEIRLNQGLYDFMLIDTVSGNDTYRHSLDCDIVEAMLGAYEALSLKR